MRDVKRICVLSYFYSWEWPRFTVAWLKRKINLKYRAFSTRYITNTGVSRAVWPVSFPASLWWRTFVRAKGNVRERQWGLGYNAWQIDCLNRIGFNELHRRAFRGQKGTTDGKNVRAPHATMEIRRQTVYRHRRKGYFFIAIKSAYSCDFDSCMYVRVSYMHCENVRWVTQQSFFFFIQSAVTSGDI